MVRIVTQKAKENPYINNPGWRNRVKEEEEKNSLTLGQRLALKHQIAEKPKPSETSSKVDSNKTKKVDSGEESEWTWETCSSSSQEDDGYEYTTVNNKTKVKTPPPPAGGRRPAVVYSKSNTTTLCSTEDSKSIKQTTSTPATPNSAVRNRWLESLADPKPKASSQTERIPNFGSTVSLNKHLLGGRETEKTPAPAAPAAPAVPAPAPAAPAPAAPVGLAHAAQPGSIQLHPGPGAPQPGNIVPEIPDYGGIEEGNRGFDITAADYDDVVAEDFADKFGKKRNWRVFEGMVDGEEEDIEGVTKGKKNLRMEMTLLTSLHFSVNEESDFCADCAPLPLCDWWAIKNKLTVEEGDAGEIDKKKRRH